MSKRVINIGNAPNDGTGDPLRTGLSKVNENFTGDLIILSVMGTTLVTQLCSISTLARNLQVHLLLRFLD